MNQYPIYQIITKDIKRRNKLGINKVQSKISIQVGIIIIQSNQQNQGEMIEKEREIITQMDGQYKINQSNYIIEIYQLIQIIQIQQVTKKERQRGEIYQIIISSIIGVKYQQYSNDIILTIISWEQQNQSQYQMISMQGRESYKGGSQAAGIKYFQQSAQTTGIQQMGVAILFSITGSTNVEIQKIMIPYQRETEGIIIRISQTQITITFIFKQAGAPFHNWAPDLYDNIPTTIAMWIAIIPKITQMIQYQNIQNQFQEVENIWKIIGIISLIIGSVGLSTQWKIKRFIAYSAISHIGIQILAQITQSIESFKYYIYIYGLQNIIFFMIIITYKISKREKIKQGDQKGMYNKNVTQSIIFAQTIFSFAGIPPQGGFFAKQKVIESIMIQNQIIIAQLIIITSVISTGNYQTVIKTIQYEQPEYRYKIRINTMRSNIISIIISIIIFIYQKTTLQINQVIN